jgi:hypothetical protein
MIDITISDPLIQILILIAVLVVAWVIIRLLLRLTARVFTCGCSVILLLGLLLLIWQQLSGN